MTPITWSKLKECLYYVYKGNVLNSEVFPHWSYRESNSGPHNVAAMVLITGLPGSSSGYIISKNMVIVQRIKRAEDQISYNGM